MSELSAVWLFVSVLYMGTAVYLHLAHRAILPRTVPATFLSLGAAIFIALNRSAFARTDLQMLAGEMLAIALLVIAWLAALLAVRAYIELVTSTDEINWPCQ